jgi:cytochrome c biogenesis protein CcmG/thiol:disulfide interchange protein DsbE
MAPHFLVAFLAVGCAGASTSRIPSSNQPVDFVLPTLGGDQLGARDLRGHVVLLDFWATWCVPCKESLPFYQYLAEARRGSGLRVVAVSVDSDRSEVSRFVTKHQLTFDVLLDAEGSLAARFDLPTMPTLFLLDREGKVVWQHAGFKARDKTTIEERIDAALRE